MSARIKSVPEFKKAVKLAVQLGKRTEVEILNRWLIAVLLRAYTKTKKAKPGKIKGDLLQDRLAIRVTMERFVRKGKPLTRSGPKGRFSKKDAMSKAAKKMISARMRSAQYIAVGFLKAAQDAGSKGRGKKINPKSEAAKSYATKATHHRLRAFLGNNSVGADIIAEGPLLDAMREIANEEIAYATERLQKQFDKVSARRKK